MVDGGSTPEGDAHGCGRCGTLWAGGLRAGAAGRISHIGRVEERVVTCKARGHSRGPSELTDGGRRAGKLPGFQVRQGF